MNEHTLLEFINTLKQGDLSARLPQTINGVQNQLALELNGMASFIQHLHQELIKLQNNLNHTREELEHIAEYKSQFMCSISDELKNPIREVLKTARSLASNTSGNLSPQQEDKIRSICQTTENLEMLIDNIFDFSMMSHDELVVNMHPFELKDLLEEINAYAQHRAITKGIAFNILVEPSSTSDELFCDQEKMCQLLKLMLDNAFKFTMEGQVTLRLGKGSLDNAKRQGAHILGNPQTIYYFSVEDTGMGIEPKHHEGIFEAFYKEPTPHNKKSQGAGLGLTIAHELARWLDGDLILNKSVPNEGSIFTFYLPQYAQAQETEDPYPQYGPN